MIARAARIAIVLALAANVAAQPSDASAADRRSSRRARTVQKQAPKQERIGDLGELRRVVDALENEDAAEAESILAPILAAQPTSRAVQTVAGMVRFHQQRYDESVALLEKGKFATGPIDYLSIARASRELTRSHVRVEGQHFVVSHPKGKDEILVPYLLEALEAQWRALEQDLGWAPPGKVAIEILNDTRELARVSTLSEEVIKTSGTIALCKFGKLTIVSPKALLRGYDWLDTAAHEYTHHVVTARTRNAAPIWLQEGIAKYSEARWRGSAGQLSIWAARLLQDAIKKDRLITFEQMHPSLAKLPSQQAVGLAFAEVTVAVEYLQARGGKAVMNAILDRISRGTPADKAVAIALGVPFEQFLSDWKRHMAGRPVPERGETKAQKLRFKGDPKHGGAHWEWSELPDEKARSFARVGEIFRERGRWTAARIEYGKAIARVGRGIPVLSDKYAMAAIMSGRDADAERALVEALKHEPRHASLNLHLARLHLKRKAFGPAKDYLMRANAVDPFDPEIHAGLAAVFEAGGEVEAAAREKRFALLLAQR